MSGIEVVCKKMSTHFCLTMSKHLSMLALVPSMLHILISPPWEVAGCLPFLPFLFFPAFFDFTPSVSLAKMVKKMLHFMAYLQDDVAPTFVLQLLDINPILPDQLAWGHNTSQIKHHCIDQN